MQLRVQSNRSQSDGASAHYSTPLSIDLNTPFRYSECLMGENEQLKQQRQKLGKRCKQLQQVSQMLQKQNVQLKKHYECRTLDIRKLIGTFQTHADESLCNHRHRIHLAKEQSALLLKQIQQALSAQETTEATLQQAHQHYCALVEDRKHMEENTLSQTQAKLKSTLNHPAINKLNQAQVKEFEALSALIRNINHLIVQCSQQKLINATLAVQCSRDNKETSSVEIHLNQNYQHLLKQIVTLTKEEKDLKNDLEFNEEKLQKIINRHQQCVRNMNDQFRIFQSSSHKLEDNLVEKETLGKLLGDVKKKMTQRGQKINQIDAKLREMTTERGKILVVMEEVRTQMTEENEKMEVSHAVKEKGAKENAKKTEDIFQQELNKINLKKEEIQASIEEAVRECQILEIDLLQRRRTIKSLINPIAQIQRAELILRLKKK